MPTARAKRLVLTGGQGAWLESSTGQRLLDATASLWHANIGHGRAGIAQAAYEQMRKLETYHTFGRFANEPALRLADRLVEIGPIPGAKVMLTSGGSDSVDLACKLARRHWQLEGRPGKKIILSRIGAYHGLHAYGTSIAGLPYNRDGYGTSSLVPETARISTNDIDRGPAVGGRARTGERRGDHRRAGHRHRRGHRPGRGLSAGAGGPLPAPRHPVHRRRGDHRLRPDRSPVRVAAVGHPTRHDHHGQGDHVRICPTGWGSGGATGVGPVLPGPGRADLPPRPDLFRSRHGLRGGPGQPGRARRGGPGRAVRLAGDRAGQGGRAVARPRAGRGGARRRRLHGRYPPARGRERATRSPRPARTPVFSSGSSTTTRCRSAHRSSPRRTRSV